MPYHADFLDVKLKLKAEYGFYSSRIILALHIRGT